MINQESRSASKDNKIHFSANSNFPFNEDSRSRSIFLNNTYLHNFLDFTSQFKEDIVEKFYPNYNKYFRKQLASAEKIEENNSLRLKRDDSKKCVLELNDAKIMPMMFQSESEPRYVNAAQYHRMMIMRIKRAQKVIKYQHEMQKYKEQQQGLDVGDQKRKYKYESRHLHAKNRQRGSDGKFVKKEDQIKPQKQEVKQDQKSKKIKKIV